MHILVAESGEVVTKHDTGEFNLLRSYVLLGNLAASASENTVAVEVGPDTVAPKVTTDLCAKYIAGVIAQRIAHGRENGELADTTLQGAFADTESENTTIIQWPSRESVQAVRSRMFTALLEEGYRPGRTTTVPEWIAGQVIYDGLVFVENVLRLPTDKAAEQAALFNNIDSRVV